jgi:hypothetical protein
MTKPRPLFNLFDYEDKIFRQSRDTATSTTELADILDLIELALDVMWRAGSIDQVTDDGKAISAIVARVFNSSAVALRAALSGHYQTAFALMRDLVAGRGPHISLLL